MKLVNSIYTLIRYYPGNKLNRIFKPIEAPAKAQKNKYNKILFCPFAPFELNIVREGIWAHACKLKGAEVKMISYDLYLPAIDFITPGTRRDLKTSYFIVKKLFRKIGLPAIYLSDFKNENKISDISTFGEEEISSLTYKEIPIGDLIIASTVRYFYCNGPEWDNPVFLQKARDYAKSALILAEKFENLLHAERPDKLVMSHGIYVSWGIPFRIARNQNIPVDVYGASYRKDTLRFYHDTPNAPLPESEWSHFKDIKLSSEEETEIDRYNETRSTQKEDSVTLFSEDDVFPASLKRFLEDARSSNQKVFCLFTNISWDGFMFRQDSSTFLTMVDFVEENIKYFSEKKDARLIIKAHPAEAYFKVPEKYRVKNIINKALPDNIYFIDEVADIKPVLLYDFTDMGLIYTSTVSIEMAFRNIPVLTAGVGGHYSNRGFTIDPVTKSEYFATINSFLEGKLVYKPDLEMAKRYLYYRFYTEAIKNDFLEVYKYKISKYNFSSMKALLPGKNKSLDIITEGILNDNKYIN